MQGFEYTIHPKVGQQEATIDITVLLQTGLTQAQLEELVVDLQAAQDELEDANEVEQQEATG